MGTALRLPATRVHRDIAAPAGAVWDLLIDVRAWPQWGPSVRRAVLDGDGTRLERGSRGTVWTVAGVRLPFAVCSFEPGRHWSWRVAGVRATGHTVTPRAGGCRVVFEVPWWAPVYLTVCAVALERIEKMAVAREQPG